MTIKGIIRGKTIELEESLPFLEGQAVRVSVEPAQDESPPGVASSILQAMRAPPHLNVGDIDVFERALAEGRLPVRQTGIFDAG